MEAQGAEAIVMFNDSEPHFEESGESHDLTLKEAFKSVNTYEDMPWGPGNLVTPSVASGCLVKVLHFDPLTEALSFLYSMTPRFAQDNISYHDSAEESYHIWGTSWMMQFGELPTGGYFWRPAYINHGSFRCKYGTIAFGRTDSVLFNYFHYNPWTNPKQNLLRAAAQHEENIFFPYFARRLPSLLAKAHHAAVGISLNYLSQAVTAFALAGCLRHHFPGITLVMGGGLVTSWLRKPAWQNTFDGLIDLLVGSPLRAFPYSTVLCPRGW